MSITNVEKCRAVFLRSEYGRDHALKKEHVIARRAKPDAPQGGLSCPSGNSPSGNPPDFPDTKLVHPSVHGIATGLRPRNDVLYFLR